MSSVAILRLGGGLFRSGMGLLALGLTTGLGLILHYFYVTPFEICSAALATAIGLRRVAVGAAAAGH